MDEFFEKRLFSSEIESELNGLEFQKNRIIKSKSSEQMVSPVHDADFYVIILRRIYRRIENLATRDSRVANLKGKYRILAEKIKIRDHFEHGIDYGKLPPTDVSDIPEISLSIASEIANIKIGTSVFINKNSARIISGSFKWDLQKDHELFGKMIEEFVRLYPFQ